jgi:hypothetical protein
MISGYNSINHQRRITMATYEQVEKLRLAAGVSFKDAKETLEKTDGDMLEAVLLLEKEGKVNSSEQTQRSSSTFQETSQEEKTQSKNDDTLSRFVDWLKHVLHLGNINDFVVYKSDKDVIAIPLTIFVVLLILAAVWVVFPLMIIGLFFGYRYRFAGPNFTDNKVNRSMDIVSDATLKAGALVKESVESISKEFKKDEQS